MGKIFYLMGKSSSGKDTIFKELKKRMPFLHTVTIYTTRPMRENERDGEEYFFVDDKVLDAFQKENRVIELREYHTVHGIWKYFTADDVISGKGRLYPSTWKWKTENVFSGHFQESGCRRSRNMRKCAEDFWQIQKISPRKTSADAAYRGGFKI